MNYQGSIAMKDNATSYSSQAGLGAQCANPIQGRTPSMEERLTLLQAGVERLYSIRKRLDYVNDRLVIRPENECTTPCAPPSADLSGKFGDAISSIHVQADALERLLSRVESALFDEKSAQTDCKQGR